MRVKRVLGIGVLTILVLLVVGITATVGWRPIIGPRNRPLTDRRFDHTPERLERGRYLVTHVSGCLFCHSDLDSTVEGLPVREGAIGAGRTWEPEGMPWLTAPNLTADTETGAASWSDDTIARAIREGIGHDGRALFPLMPYDNYRQMSDEDLASIVIYIRSLPGVRRELPETRLPFPVSRLINSAPQPLDGPVSAPDLSTPAKRGEYLATLASCNHCHSAMTRGAFIPGLRYAGGNLFRYQAIGPVASANLTPSPSGIPYYTEDLFIEAMRTGRVRDRKLADVMPWGHYRGMTDEDLKSLFVYLLTLAPVDHYVDNTMPATACPRCGNEHGGGERNKKL